MTNGARYFEMASKRSRIFLTVAIAMQLRGFTTPNEHQVEWQQLRLGTSDVLALAALVGLWMARIIWGTELP